MGHASVQITLDRYGHLFPNVRREAVLRLEKSLFPLTMEPSANPAPEPPEPHKAESEKLGSAQEDYLAEWEPDGSGPGTRPDQHHRKNGPARSGLISTRGALGKECSGTRAERPHGQRSAVKGTGRGVGHAIPKPE